MKTVFSKYISYKIIFVIIGFSIALAAKSQIVAVKTNPLYWLTTSVNAAIEIKLSDRITTDLAGAYNPWTFNDDRKMRFWLAQPELRYWFCEAFEGHFVGLHVHGAQFFGGFRNRRYDGYLVGTGISYGYGWIISPHWNIEAQAGVGYARLWYKDGPRIPCIKCYEKKNGNYWGLTKLSLSISYIF